MPKNIQGLLPLRCSHERSSFKETMKIYFYIFNNFRGVSVTSRSQLVSMTYKAALKIIQFSPLGT